MEDYYYLQKTDRQYIIDLFPKHYQTNKEQIEQSKVLEYVRGYLKALKVMLAEPDFQKLLYDPSFWIYGNPYR